MTQQLQTLNTTATTTEIGGTVQQYLWNYQGQEFAIAYETLGQGAPILLLPAFSTVSTRAEMAGLAKRLASEFQVVAIDWLGFGESARPPINYEPAVYHQLLQEFVGAIFQQPVAVVAAGHAAGYAMKLAQRPGVLSRVALVAPTWRGPLPTMGVQPKGAGVVRGTVRSPLLGQALYKLNTTPSFLALMYRRHVYADPANVTPDLVDRRWHSTQQPGARFAPAAFVTGALDPVRDRADFLAWCQPLPTPLMVVIGEQAPPKSKAEMEAIAALPGVQTQKLTGSLGLHEEYPAPLAEAILPFLRSPD
ncbi:MULTISPECIES: alpha/beta fold hydrolase [Trichocoleus]|uniref:Alpha/beta fold hydrolase n=1 Tax=Trichocoleus desertorum GB2-A4 TaxID=2933944 RepID=A0ABV0JBA1_9CYAN|nr:alpha/beta fold hydrolase [Trichocoleus sp. FACHB-46]MBD1864691.1 alpha/beta fold hydrolase [Trichocoleus sp. FACHB-46]